MALTYKQAHVLVVEKVTCCCFLLLNVKPLFVTNLFPSNFLIGFYVHFELKREIKRSRIDININGVNFKDISGFDHKHFYGCK